MNKKTYEVPLDLGVDLQSPLSMIKNGRLSYMKNLICKGGILSKRNGYKSIKTFLDEDFSKLQINGIYSYSTYNDQEEPTPCYILHAGANLYKCETDLGSCEKIPLDDGVEIQDTKTRGFLVDNNLFIIGNKEVLVYDGEKIKSPYSVERLYVPTTTIGITDHRHEMKRYKRESPNLLSGKRKNTLMGSNLYVNSAITGNKVEAPIFLLDADIKPYTKMKVNVRIRVRKSTDLIDDTTSCYIGVDANGDEVNTIVNVKYEIDSVSPLHTAYLLREPITDDDGREIRIKLSEEDIRSYDKLGWAMGIKSRNEIYFSFDLTPPIIGLDNISVEFEEINDDKGDFIYSTLGAVANSNTGGVIMLLCYDNNKIAYSLPNKNGLYFPRDNCVSVGNYSSPIKGILQMHDNLIGVYKERSFYRLNLENSDSLSTTTARVYHSSDECGAVNEYVLCNVDNDSVSFGENGVYGYGSTSNLAISPCLSSRGKNIEAELSSYSESEKKSAVAICHDRRYYLFIKDKVYIADSRYKTRDSSGNSGIFEYEWWVWECPSVRVAVSLDNKIYLGTKDGEIITLDNEFSDRYSVIYRVSHGELLCKSDNEKTTLYFDMESPPDTSEGVYLSEHEALLSKGALCISENREFKVALTDFIKNGSAYIYDGMEARVYNSKGEILLSGKIYDSNISKLTFKIDAEEKATVGEMYTVYLYHKTREIPYELFKLNDGYILKKGGEPVLIKDTEGLCAFIDKNEEIECEVHTPLISFSEPANKKTLTRVLLLPSASTSGEIELVYESEKNKSTKRLNISNQLNFDLLNFDRLSFSDMLGKAYVLPCLERNFRFIRFKIKSRSKGDFGIESIFCTYSTIKGGI